MKIKSSFLYYENRFGKFIDNHFWEMCLFAIVMCVIFDYCFASDRLPKDWLGKADDLKEIVNIMIAINSMILVYYGLIPKINLNMLIEILTKIQGLEAGHLLEAKYFYDKYYKTYREIKKNQEQLNKVRLLNYGSMLLVIAFLHCWQYAKNVTLGWSIFFTVIILIIAIAIGSTTDNLFIYNLSEYPEPDKLLSFENDFSGIRELSIQLDDHVQLPLLTAGIVINVISANREECLKEHELHKLTFYKDITCHLSLSAALPFNLHGVVFNVYKDNRLLRRKKIEQYRYNYTRINPAIELLSKDFEIDQGIRFILTFKTKNNQIVDLCFERCGEKYIVNNVVSHIEEEFFLSFTDEEFIII